MKAALGNLIANASFESAEFAIMQSVFDQACKDREACHPEHRAAMATAILHAYSHGERDRGKLLDAAMAAAVT